MITLLLSKATSHLLKDVKTNFKPKSTYEQINKGMVELKSVAPAFAET
jgi:hypothetical protein